MGLEDTAVATLDGLALVRTLLGGRLLEEALDLGWKILADCFEKGEVGIPTKLSDKFWPKG